jgi:hypothetical protein
VLVVFGLRLRLAIKPIFVVGHVIEGSAARTRAMCPRPTSRSNLADFCLWRHIAAPLARFHARPFLGTKRTRPRRGTLERH